MKEIRRIKSELADREKKMPAAQQVAVHGAFDIRSAPRSREVEDSLYQTKNRSGQDPLNYPIRLNNRIGALLGVVQSADGRPTQQSLRRLQGVDGRAEQGSHEAAIDDQRESSAHQHDVEGGGTQGDRREGADRLDGAAQAGEVDAGGTAIPMA